jgi:hypothetical protein
MRQRRHTMDPALVPHLLILCAIAAGTLVLLFAPQSVLQAGYRCELQTLVGLRCPFCGMTRDFAAILHGSRPTQNPGSWFAACIVWLIYPAAVLAGWYKGCLSWFYSRAAHYAVAVTLGIMLVANNWR